MKNRKLVSIGATAALLLAGAVAKAAQVPFSDSFTNLDNWTTTIGSVDLVTPGSFAEPGFAGGFKCNDGIGGCVDLNGSTGVTGHFVSTSFSLSPGTYKLTFALSGNQRGGTGRVGATDPDTVTVAFGSFTQDFQKNPGDSFETFTKLITFSSATDAQIIFGHKFQDSDNIGLVLDSLTLTPVPVPAAAVLFLSALCSFGLFRRRQGVAENA